MNPSVRSRLVASGLSFLLGFGLANYGILFIQRPDQWVWLAVSAMFMATGALGVLFADTSRAISMWAILGIQVFAIFVAVPLLGLFTLATRDLGSAATSLWPEAVSWGAFSDVLGSSQWRRTAATTALVAGVATLVAIPLAAAAAYALVRHRVRGGRVVYGLVLAALLMPLVSLAGSLADLSWAWNVYDNRWALVVPYLLITLPLGIWLCVSVMRDVPWRLYDTVRADGASRAQILSRFVVPHVLPGVFLAAAVVFVVACNDLVLGAALTVTDDNRPLPATVLLTAREPDSAATVAAVGLLWLTPAALLLLIFPRRIARLLGRPYR